MCLFHCLVFLFLQICEQYCIDVVAVIEINSIQCCQQRGKAERINRRLRQQIGAFHVPDVMEYVTEKAELYELKKNVRSWERKVEIVEVCNF